MDISYTTEEILNTIDDKEIEVLIIASIKTLKGQKSKCSKDEVFKLVKDTRGGSRTAATSSMEYFVIIVNGFQPLLLSQSVPSWMLQQS